MTSLARILAPIAVAGASLLAHAGPGGTLIVLNKSEATASVLDRDTGDTIATLPTGVGPHEAAISPDGKTAVVADYGEQTPGASLTVIDLTGKSVIRTIDLGAPARPHGIQFEPDGVHVAVTAETRGALLRVNVETGETAASIPTDQQASHMVVLSPDGTRAYVSNIASGSVSVIDLGKGELVTIVETGAGAEGLDVTPDGSELWVGNRANDTVTVIDTKTLEVTGQLRCGRFPIRVKVTPDGGRVLVSCAASGDVAVFDAKTREELARVPMADGAGDAEDGGTVFTQGPVPIGILIPGDGRHAYIANTNADIVTVIDLESYEIVSRLTAGQTPDGMAWSPLDLAADEEL
ncbi:MAG: cytochrome D1 domain-containing protein [Phycisphaerales bacterium JB040]